MELLYTVRCRRIYCTIEKELGELCQTKTTSFEYLELFCVLYVR